MRLRKLQSEASRFVLDAWLDDRMKECEMDETCNMHGRKDKLVQKFGGKAWKNNLLQDQGMEGRIIIKYIFKK
jgi:hypothetical protein